MASEKKENTYLNEVMQQEQVFNRNLKRRSMPMPQSLAHAAPARQRRAQAPAPAGGGGPPLLGGDEPGRAVEYRITGWWRWKTVVVPPNAYVVHTRRGHKDPVDIGLGISFRFDPVLDSFLIVPAAMQTILINARAICLERQGILVQAYVQWIIEDIETAYRKLDFSDPADPMGIVNIQLKAQAEAAIKDKVATMSIDDVLNDKQPIVDELTARLRQVAEGDRKDGSGGLGLKIVTVQLQEAVVSSTTVWENLQRPFRAERARIARLAELETEKQLAEREQSNRIERENRALRDKEELDRLRAEQEASRFDREHGERQRRDQAEQERQRALLAEQQATALARGQQELALRLAAIEREAEQLDAELAALERRKRQVEAASKLVQAELAAELALSERRRAEREAEGLVDLALAERKRQIDNQIGDGPLRQQLIEKLPEIAAHTKVPKELREVHIGTQNHRGHGLSSTVAEVLALVDGLRREGGL